VTVSSCKPLSTNVNTVTETQLTQSWTAFNAYVNRYPIGGATISTPSASSLDLGSETSLISSGGVSGTGFWLHVYRDATDTSKVWLESTGKDGQASRKIKMLMSIGRNNDVLQYAVASRGRMWLAGDSTVHGNVFSSWNLSPTQITNILNGTTQLSSLSAPTLAPFNTTADSCIDGTINTCWSKDQLYKKDAQGNFLTDGQNHLVFDSAGNPVLNAQGQQVTTSYLVPKSWEFETLRPDGTNNYTSSGNQVVAASDQVQGSCKDINYGVSLGDMPGMNVADYDTTTYYNATKTTNGGGGDIAVVTSGANKTPTVAEYFPHGVNSNGTNNYGMSVSGSLALTRYKFTNKTFTNVRLKDSTNALFDGCTFNGVLFVDSSGNVATGVGTSKYNNVRFNNCTFNGTIVTNTPQGSITTSWQKDALYFTGSATFQNETTAEATILAPNFNVNLGNANPIAGTNNVLRGAIVGGIVDVRGNAEVYGTIISMADTSGCTSGYVTNIGATLDDGGSETVAIDDIGTINITPDQSKMLPSGVTTPIVIKPDQTTYSEAL
jgi:hypothetical protein